MAKITFSQGQPLQEILSFLVKINILHMDYRLAMEITKIYSDKKYREINIWLMENGMILKLEMKLFLLRQVKAFVKIHTL